MKIHHILCLSAAIALPQLALAKLPFSVDGFGQVEGILDFCAQTNPQAAPKYQERKKALVRDVPEEEVAEARKTTEYKNAYDWIRAELDKVPKDKAAETCSASLKGDK